METYQKRLILSLYQVILYFVFKVYDLPLLYGKPNVFLFQSTFTCSTSTIETPERYVKLFKVSNKDNRTTSITLFWCFHLLTWNRFHTLIWSFHCWLWANKCWLGYLFRTDVLISCQCSHWFQNIPFYSRCYRLLKSIKINRDIDTKYLSLCFLQPLCSQTFIENSTEIGAETLNA